MLEKVQSDRLNKLEQVRELGVDPYGWRYNTAEPIADVLDRFKDDDDSQTADAAGRLVLIRKMGNLVFAHIRDEGGQMQVAFSKKGLDENTWKLVKLLDLGDIVAVAGKLARTRTGEVTIWGDKLTLLCKSLNPMPEKFHGLVDVEIRYRQRYLDLMTNPDTMATFKSRIAIIEHFRSLLKGQKFVEVETPMLQGIYGGAAARPFVTHHNALDADLFMRISPELYLKRLLVGGFEKVFEINRNFRNEGLSTRHNPEFTMMELYQAYADYEVMMDITEELISTAAENILQDLIMQLAQTANEHSKICVNIELCEDDIRNLELLSKQEWSEWDEPLKRAISEKLSELLQQEGPLKRKLNACAMAFEGRKEGRITLPYGDIEIDYSRPWRRVTYEELLLEHAGVAMRDIAAVRDKARELHIEEANKDDAVVINEVFEATVEQHLIQPTFVKDYPAELCPLTRRKPDDDSIALRFELFIAGMEIANAYTELNDPAIQEANFAQQLRGEADGETMRVMDEDFVAALRHGMPPAGGLGIGIDRVVMLLTNTQSIRDVILFPMLRQEAKE